VVDAVDELGAEEAHHLAHACSRSGGGGTAPPRQPTPDSVGTAEPRLLVRMTIVRRKSAVTPRGSVRRPASDLQQQVERVDVGLLDLVEQHHRERTLAHGRREQARFAARADQALERVVGGVLAHVEAHEAGRVAEEQLGHRAGELGLADARGPDEEQHAVGLARVREPGLHERHQVEDRGDGLGLAHHAALEELPHARGSSSVVVEEVTGTPVESRASRARRGHEQARAAGVGLDAAQEPDGAAGLGGTRQVHAREVEQPVEVGVGHVGAGLVADGAQDRLRLGGVGLGELDGHEQPSQRRDVAEPGAERLGRGLAEDRDRAALDVRRSIVATLRRSSTARRGPLREVRT
jgi:hypothetical protein